MAQSNLWFTELQNENLSIGLRIEKTIHSERTEFQQLDVYQTAQYGKLLVLDGCVMTTDKDEFVYHEMLAHVPLHTHPNPKSVLVVGGGDGGIIREVIKHPSVERAVLAEIDGRVIEASKTYFPQIAAGLSDPRVDVQVVDGIRYVEEHPGEFDVILIDSTDPVGPAVGLFSKSFYESVHTALKPDGLMAAQTESPFVNQELIRRVYGDVARTFPIAKLYVAFVPTYPTGMWSFTMGSKVHRPEDVKAVRVEDTKYYNLGIHHAALALPNFVKELVGE
ncbi:spermidine synthase [Alicyclobacillus hesperidum URH17-3-68]|uniref:Polyamine aminopropyltransferase n=1 Tax=Alicyclobacillus hesperidum TaxID=89784 RepID=A0A1H2VSH9_9BACL|nr:polyamine aminopropyltransferase [Alicyclobacillus hesperidum]EJY56658.1 spermidine synthase [Alicyclobacillus hesperidum URH17-3-68]GLG01980.1 polyamine aminopropyltransferase [Alicyclobacillus hesperidum subsp. aegles]GLV14247.1 polyamine aminopropyltransferase [Alicyclobacillus hesperidum]SDW71362.1 spermidine synthase [Alicyclobacillus hesperidum]